MIITDSNHLNYTHLRSQNPQQLNCLEVVIGNLSPQSGQQVIPVVHPIICTAGDKQADIFCTIFFTQSTNKKNQPIRMLYHSHTFKFTNWKHLSAALGQTAVKANILVLCGKSLSNVSKFAVPPIKIRFEPRGCRGLVLHNTVLFYVPAVNNVVTGGFKSGVETIS